MEVGARRTLLAAVVVSLVATAAIAIGTLLVGDFGETEGRVLLTTASVSFSSLLSLAPGILLEQSRLRPLAIAGLVLPALGFVVALTVIWVRWNEAGEGSWKTLAVTTTLALALTQASAVEARRREGDGTWVRRLAAFSHASAALAAALVCIAVLAEVDDEAFFRALGAVVVGNLLLVALQPVLRRMGADAVRHQLVLVLEGGERREVAVAARDFASAVERSIRDEERAGGRVLSVERG